MEEKAYKETRKLSWSSTFVAKSQYDDWLAYPSSLGWRYGSEFPEEIFVVEGADLGPSWFEGSFSTEIKKEDQEGVKVLELPIVLVFEAFDWGQVDLDVLRGRIVQGLCEHSAGGQGR